MAAKTVPIALAFGVFDGVHRGHQRLFQELRGLAQRYAARTAALFFDPFPKAVLFPETAPRMLCSRDEKITLLQQAGVQEQICFPFDHSIAALSPQEFLERYVFSCYDLAAFCVGKEWRFGRGNCGNVDLLQRLAGERGIPTRVVSPLWHNGEPISSTRIRAAIAAGQLSEAAEMLGRPYSLGGVVSHGLGLAGEKLQCPTANIANPQQQLPPYGVYAAWIRLPLDNQSYPGIVYIGDAPTIRGESSSTVVIELHLFAFSGDLYGRDVSVQPLEFLRPSRKFSSRDELARQIASDLDQAKQIIARHSGGSICSV